MLFIGNRSPLNGLRNLNNILGSNYTRPEFSPVQALKMYRLASISCTTYYNPNFNDYKKTWMVSNNLQSKFVHLIDEQIRKKMCFVFPFYIWIDKRLGQLTLSTRVVSTQPYLEIRLGSCERTDTECDTRRALYTHAEVLYSVEKCWIPGRAWRENRVQINVCPRNAYVYERCAL
jgi:hypothetical protein